MHFFLGALRVKSYLVFSPKIGLNVSFFLVSRFLNFLGGVGIVGAIFMDISASKLLCIYVCVINN